MRMVTSTKMAKHLEFWLGGKMGENLITMEWFVMKPGARTGAKRVVVTVPYFQQWLAHFRRVVVKGIVDIDALEDVTTNVTTCITNTRPEYAKHFHSLGWANRGNCVCCQKVSSFET